jgi:hypothetical protein
VGRGVASVKAGSFAEERFRARRRAWRRRIWWVFPPFALILVGICVGLGVLLRPEDVSFFLGLAIGLAVAMTVVIADSPPHHIERWRQGAEGEKATAKSLRPLVRDGWTLVNDIDTGRGNLDHILVGPPGILLLQSKNLHGMLSVSGGILMVRWREDPDDGYEHFRLAQQMRSRARDLEHELRNRGLDHPVQPVVVLWGTFPQRSILSKQVAWVHGKELRRVLEARPARLTDADIQRAVQATAHVFDRPSARRPR